MNTLSYSPEMLHFINQFPGMVGYLDMQHKVLLLNKVAIQLLGFKSLDHAIGKTSFDIPSKASECAAQYFAQDEFVLKNEKNLQVLDICEYSDRSIHIWLTNKSLLRNEIGEKMGVFYYTYELNATAVDLLFRQILGSSSAANATTYWLNEGGYSDLLSERQNECLFYLVRGKSCREIGEILALSPRTIETHVDEIKNKLGCQHKSEVIEKAIDSGLLYSIPKSLLKRNVSLQIDN